MVKQLTLRLFFGFSLLACSCWYPEPEEYLKEENLIFFGKVTAIKNLETYTKKDQGIIDLNFTRLICGKRVLKKLIFGVT